MISLTAMGPMTLAVRVSTWGMAVRLRQASLRSRRATAALCRLEAKSDP